jgi:prophage DNA circulation protein
MTLALFGQTIEAKYKGFSVLIPDSEIAFGQKTVVHNYPNTDKTEVEFLGLKEDEFSLSLIVHGSSYLEKRNRLKKLLEEPSLGVLQHPYQGQINVSVISARLRETNRELGRAIFEVVFQKSTNKDYPIVSKNTKPFILRKLDSLFDTVESGFDFLTNDYKNNAIFNATKIGDVLDTFDNAIRLTYKVTDKTNEINKDILDFRSKIGTYAVAPALLGSALKSLFSTINFISEDNKEQIRIMKSFFTFGFNDSTILETTLERKERKNVKDTIDKCMLVNSLGIAYATASDVDYTNNEDLNTIRDLLEEQFNIVRELLDVDTLDSLSDLRTDVLSYLDGLNLVEVSTITIQPTSTLLLSYMLYGDATRYDDLFKLNKFKDPAFISGEVKILNE